MRGGRKKDTLCWDCKKASFNGCSWDRKLIPVEGWKAERVMRPDVRGGETFHVISCPEFEQDRKPEPTQPKNAYTPHELDVIRNGVQNGESAVMIAWRLNRGVYGVRDRIRMMRRRGEI